jgi:hypothetical protein
MFFCYFSAASQSESFLSFLLNVDDQVAQLTIKLDDGHYSLEGRKDIEFSMTINFAIFY